MLKKKTLSRILALALALISVGSLIVPAMAAEPVNEYDVFLYWTDQVLSESGEMATDVFDFYRKWTDHDFQWNTTFNGTTSHLVGSGSDSGNVGETSRVAFGDGAYFHAGSIKYYITGHNLYSIDSFPDYGSLTLRTKVGWMNYHLSASSYQTYSASVPVTLYLECYDANKNLIMDAPFNQQTIAQGSLVEFDTILVLPGSVAYICPYVVFNISQVAKVRAFKLSNYFNMYFNLRHTYAIGEDNPPRETLPDDSGSGGSDGSMDEIKDAIANQGKEEQDAADSQGNASLDELTGAVPDESQGFMDAIKSLVGAMSYNGTDAQLTIPAVTIPGIPGVMSGYTLMGSNKIDFGYWVQKMPSNIITLVQALLTLALIGYSFKELYSLISYLFTLKGAGSD